MPSFSVYTEFDINNASPDTYEGLLDALDDAHGAVAPSPTGNLSARITVHADNISQAAVVGIKTVQDAVRQRGLPSEAISAEVMTEAEFDRRQSEK